MVKKSKQKNENLSSKPPVVVVLGHVDHGKSSLLEAIRDFKITTKESGGITQHIGAYEIEEKGKKITFIDTPGHEAFSAMRSRGAQVADIALLVVDASEGVQPQTKEAVMAVKKAGIPMIVVLNKMDKPTADPEKAKRELSKIDIFVESMGGKIPSVEVSAMAKTGIKELLELILLVAEMESLKVDTKSAVEGIVIESYLDSFRGPVATLIVKQGVLKKKDIIATHSAWAKIKNLEDFQGKLIKEAHPSQPSLVLGFESVPGIGEKFKNFTASEQAQDYVKKHELKKETSFSVLQVEPDKKILNIILKADVLGSLEAIEGVLKTLPQDKVFLRILKSDVGDINESDVKLVEMSKGQIIGFRVKINPNVIQALKKDKKIRIKTFEVIYDLIQDVRQAMEKTLESEVVRQDFGKIKALIIFWGEKNRQIVGGKIIEGEIRKGLRLDVIRNEEKIGSGKIINLQRDKKDMEKLVKGDECGILYEGNVKIQEKDILAAYAEEKRKGEL